MNLEKIIFDNEQVKVYFKEHDQHDPMIGKFVQLSDSADLERKGMVRFVNAGKEDIFEISKDFTGGIGHNMHTRIFEARLFTQIRYVNGSKVIY